MDSRRHHRSRRRRAVNIVICTLLKQSKTQLQRGRGYISGLNVSPRGKLIFVCYYINAQKVIESLNMKKSLVEPQHSVAPRTHCLLTRARNKMQHFMFLFLRPRNSFLRCQNANLLVLKLPISNQHDSISTVTRGRKAIGAKLIDNYGKRSIYSWKRHKTMEVEIRIEISYVEISYVGCCELCAIGADKNLSWL